MNNRREFITLFGIVAVPLLTRALFAQTTVRLPRIGYLTPVALPFDDEFRRGLRDLGYVDR
jgi:hypothetical protein